MEERGELSVKERKAKAEEVVRLSQSYENLSNHAGWKHFMVQIEAEYEKLTQELMTCSQDELIGLRGQMQGLEAVLKIRKFVMGMGAKAQSDLDKGFNDDGDNEDIESA